MIPFVKMHGIGNDFVMVDRVRHPLDEASLPELAKAMCDRRFGIGSDGLILLETGDDAPFRMRMLNPDGSESEMCGNGIRCFVRFLKSQGHGQADRIDVETGAGVLTLTETHDGRVKVDMGPARLTRSEIPVNGPADETFVAQPILAAGQEFSGTAVSMGNPHLVLFTDDAAGVPLETWGPALETHELFARKTNVHFIQVVDRRTLIQRTWERGAGVTLACGTGACASAVAAVLNGLADRQVLIHLPGGDLEIEYREDGRVMMTGPAETVFEGVWPL